MTGIPSSPLSVSKCTENNVSNQPTTWPMCIHVYYAGSASTRNVEHPESAETETLRPKSNRSGISLAFWARSLPSLAALFVLCSIEGQPLPSARTGHQPSVVSMPCSLLTHTLCLVLHRSALCRTQGLSPCHRSHACLARISSRSSHWFRVHSSIRCGSTPIASLTANRALLAPRSTGSSASLPELRLLRRSSLLIVQASLATPSRTHSARR